MLRKCKKLFLIVLLAPVCSTASIAPQVLDAASPGAKDRQAVVESLCAAQNRYHLVVDIDLVPGSYRFALASTTKQVAWRLILSFNSSVPPRTQETVP